MTGHRWAQATRVITPMNIHAVAIESCSSCASMSDATTRTTVKQRPPLSCAFVLTWICCARLPRVVASVHGCEQSACMSTATRVTYSVPIPCIRLARPPSPRASAHGCVQILSTCEATAPAQVHWTSNTQAYEEQSSSERACQSGCPDKPPCESAC